MRTRSLLATEAGKCFRTYIDDYFLDNLIVLNLYSNGATTNRAYDVYSFSYGNLASTIRVIPPAIPPYLTFTPPTYTSAVSASSSGFMWTYINTGTSATTSTVTVYKHNDAISTSRFATGTLSIPVAGQCVILATSQNCLIVSQGNAHVLYTLSQSSSGAITFKSTDITFPASLAQTKVNWRVNTDCSRFTVDSYIFALFGGSYTLVANNFIDFAWIALDQTFTYAVVAGAIWKYDSSINSFRSNYSTLDSGFTAGTTIRSYNTRVVVSRLSSSRALVNAFIDTGSALTLLPSISLTGFKSTPKIALSPQLAMVSVYGASSTAAISKLYFIDYAEKSLDELDFPDEAVFDPSSLHIVLEESWMYIRQLASSLRTAGEN